MAKKESPEFPNKPTVTDVILRRSRSRIEIITGDETLEGTSLRFEEGEIPKITKRTAGRIAVTGALFVDKKAHAKALEAEQDALGDALKLDAAEHRGLRGIDSEPTNSRITITPKLSLDWDQDVLKEALGANYNGVVHDRLTASIAVPLGLETAEGPLTTEMLAHALQVGIRTLGLKEQPPEDMVGISVSTVVDEDELGKMLSDGRLDSLPDNAAKVEESWAITVADLRKN